MPGTSPEYNRICVNFACTLDGLIEAEGADYTVGSGLVHVNDELRFYPDVVVSFGEAAQFRGDALLNPILIAEVAGKSTGGFDGNVRFKQYQTIASLQQFLLLNENRVEIAYHKKQAVGEWTLFNTYTNVADALPIQLGDTIVYVPLSDIYRDVALAE